MSLESFFPKIKNFLRNKKILIGILGITVLFSVGLLIFLKLRKPPDYLCNKKVTVSGSLVPFSGKVVTEAKYVICSPQFSSELSSLNPKISISTNVNPCLLLETPRDFSKEVSVSIEAVVQCKDNRKSENPECDFSSTGCQLYMWLKDIQLPTIENQVTLTTDKTEYEEGEVVKITVRNGLNKSIWYVDFTQQDLRFWDIEKFEDNRWRKLEYAKGESFRLPIEEGGKEVCYIVLYEIGVGQVAELKPSSELSYRWNQKICLLDSKKQPFEPVLLPKGRYRFTFTYGLDKSSDEPEMLMDNKTIYSNEFRIKEETEISTPKNCDSYEMPMTEQEIAECTCSEGYEKYYRLSGAYCATNSQLPCQKYSDCPEGESCFSLDGQNWFCSGQWAGCYYFDPEKPDEQICVD